MSLIAVVLIAVSAAASVAASRNGLGRTPMMGWSTWCTSASCYQGDGVATGNTSLHDFCDEDMILTSAQALVDTGMKAAGYEYVLLDDCWAWTSRDANGDLMPDPNRFPNGMPALISQVHALGLKIGLYTSVGPTTCSSGNRSGTIPGSYGHNEQDAALYARWGIDEMTMDYCDWHFNSTVLIPWTVTGAMSDALNATGTPIWFLFHCVGYNLINTSWCAEYGNSYTVWTDHHDNWSTTLSILFFLAGHPQYAGAESLTWPDPDFLMTGGAGCDDLTPGARCPGMSDDEYRSEFTLWALAGGQLVVATDLRAMSPLQRQVLLNAEVLAVFNDSLKTLGTLLDPQPEFLELGVSTWARPLAGGCVALALLNGAANATAGPVVTQLSVIAGSGWGNGTVVSVRDLWAHADLPTATGAVSVPPIATHATVALKLCAVAAAGADALP